MLLAGDHLIKHISSNPLIARPLDGDGAAHRAPAGAGDLHRARCARRASCRPSSCCRATASRSPTTRADRRALPLHERRADKIHGLIAERPRTAYEIAQAMWGNVAVTQAYLTLSEVLGHVDLLLASQRVREAEDDGVVRFEVV